MFDYDNKVIFYKGSVYLREVGCVSCDGSLNTTTSLACPHKKKLIGVIGYYGNPSEYPHGRKANRKEIKMIKEKYHR